MHDVMNASTRKAIGGLLMMIFLAGYVVLVINVADHLPDQKLVKMIYFIIAGTAWGLPLLPVISWMNRGR